MAKILFTIAIKKPVYRKHFAPKTKVEKSRKAYSRKQKHRGQND